MPLIMLVSSSVVHFAVTFFGKIHFWSLKFEVGVYLVPEVLEVTLLVLEVLKTGLNGP